MNSFTVIGGQITIRRDESAGQSEKPTEYRVLEAYAIADMIFTVDPKLHDK